MLYDGVDWTMCDGGQSGQALSFGLQNCCRLGRRESSHLRRESLVNAQALLQLVDVDVVDAPPVMLEGAIAALVLLQSQNSGQPNSGSLVSTSLSVVRDCDDSRVSPTMDIQVFVKTSHGRFHRLRIEVSDSISRIVVALWTQACVLPTKHLSLLRDGVRLCVTRTLKDREFQQKAMVHLGRCLFVVAQSIAPRAAVRVEVGMRELVDTVLIMAKGRLGLH